MQSLSFLGLFFLFLRQETKHPEETIGSLSLFVPVGGGGCFLILFCFVCLLYFHSVTLSPIFFEKSGCII